MLYSTALASSFLAPFSGFFFFVMGILGLLPPNPNPNPNPNPHSVVPFSLVVVP